MVVAYGFLSHSAVYPGGFNAFMSKEFLHLFDGHTGGQEIRCARPPEAVRVDSFYSGCSADAVDDILQTTPGKAVMRSFTADEKRRVIVSTGIQIVLQVDVGAGVEVCHALFVPLAEDRDIIFGKRNVRAVQAQELGSPDCGAVQAFHDSKIALGFTGGPDEFYLLRRQGLFDFLLGFYWVKRFHRVRWQDPFFYEPLKEDVKNQPDLVKIGVAYGTLVAVSIEVCIDIIVGDPGDIFVCIGKKVGDVEPVKVDSAF